LDITVVSKEINGSIKDLKSFKKLDIIVIISSAGEGDVSEAGGGEECRVGWPEVATAYVWVWTGVGGLGKRESK